MPMAAPHRHLSRFRQLLQRSGANARIGPRYLAVALTLVAFGLYLWRIEALCLWWDESLSLYRAQSDIPFILSNRIDFPGVSTIDQHPPLYFVLLHLFIRLSGQSDLVLRFLSVAAATMLVPLLYAFGLRMRSQQAGLWAALFGALSPFYLWYAQEARMYTLVTMFGFASLYALWRACAERRWTWWAVCAVTTLAALATQYLFALALVGEAILCLLLWPRAERAPLKRRAWLVTLLILSVLVALLAALSWPRLGALVATLNTGRRYVPLATILWDALNSFSLGLSVSLARVRALDLFFLGVFVVGLASTWARPLRLNHESDAPISGRSRAASFVFLGGMILLPTLILWLFSLFVPIYMNSRYLMIVSPIFYLGLGLGIETLASWKRPIGWLAAAVLAASMGVSGYRYFYDERYRAKEDYRAAAQSVMRNERVGDVVLVNGPESLVAFSHYYRGNSPVVGVPTTGSSEEHISSEMASLTQRYDRIWAVYARTAVTDPQQGVRHWLDSNNLLLSRVGFPSNGYYLRLSSYLARWPVDPAGASAPTIGTFDGRLALTDYTLRYWDADGSTHEIAADAMMRYWEQAHASPSQGGVASGASVAVVLHWQPLQPLGRYKMSLRLAGSDLTWAQRDREPFMYLPTTDWPVGVLSGYEADLRIPPGTPPGEYRLQLVVYDAETAQGLAFVDATTGREQPYFDLGPLVVSKGPQPVFDADEFVPSDAVRLDRVTVFGPALELVGYRLGPLTTKPGDDLVLTLYWRARRKMHRDYSLVVNWEDNSGRIWRSSEQSLTGALYDTPDWAAGELVWGIQRLAVPADAPPGQHQLHLLVFDRQDQRFSWVRRGLMPWSGRNLPIAEITVE